MGLCLYYTTPEIVQPAVRQAIERDARRLNRKQPWTLCEPILFLSPGRDACLTGCNKLNLFPSPEEVARSAPPGTDQNDFQVLLKQLCRWSRRHGITWEVTFEDELLGVIAAGQCGEELRQRMEGFGSLGEVLGNLSAETGEQGQEPSGPSLRLWPGPDEQE